MEQKHDRAMRSLLKTCPRCESSNVVKAGKETTSKGIFQRYRCNNCGLLSLGELVKRFPLFEERV